MTGYEKILYLLKDVDTKTPWGDAIKLVKEKNCPYATMDLVADLQSEGREHPEVMSDILGKKVYAKILKICVPQPSH